MPRTLRYASSSLAQPNRNTQLNSEYRKWLDEDVRWIITDQERKCVDRCQCGDYTLETPMPDIQ